MTSTKRSQTRQCISSSFSLSPCECLFILHFKNIFLKKYYFNIFSNKKYFRKQPLPQYQTSLLEIVVAIAF